MLTHRTDPFTTVYIKDRQDTPEDVMEMGRAAGLPTVGRSASDLPKASDLVMCAVAGLAGTLALIVTCARSIAIVCSFPHTISLVLACCPHALCFTLVKFSYRLRTIVNTCATRMKSGSR